MSDISQPVIDRILEIAPAAVLSVEGYSYLDKDKTVTLFQPPVPKPIEVATLTGLVSLLEAKFEEWKDVLIHVESPDRVEVIARESDKWGRRQRYVVAQRVQPERQFSFNQYMEQEKFVIGLRSLFVQDQSVDDLVAVAGNLSTKAELRQEDDGFTQSATVKAGVVRLAEKTINPRTALTPYRTFLEAVQPSSEYIFRIQSADGLGAKCALFDADAGNWKLQAIQNVQSWLTNQLRGSVVPQVADLLVIA